MNYETNTHRFDYSFADMNVAGLMKSVDDLKIARQLIDSVEKRYVCNALPNDSLVLKIIELRLGFEHYTAEQWLQANVPGFDIKNTPEHRENMREYRLRWIDSMIEECNLLLNLAARQQGE